MKTSDTTKKIIQLRDNGESWPSIGKKMGMDGERARARYRRAKGSDHVRNHKSCEQWADTKKALSRVSDDYGVSEQELKTILASAKQRPSQTRKVRRKRGGKSHSLKMLVISDTHIGHSKFRRDIFEEAIKTGKDVDFILHPGDHLEGMSGRPGHIYELDCIGFSAQIELCRELYNTIEKPIYGITGNHDLWFQKKHDAGLMVGEEIEERVKNYTHLGENEGDLEINGLKIKLFHPGDGSAYANSYKGQKLIESFTGGEKPHLVFGGHYHKALYQFTRNVHYWESGTICGQTEFMRGKKLPAHIGYWLVTVKWDGNGVQRVAQEFYPGYG